MARNRRIGWVSRFTRHVLMAALLMMLAACGMTSEERRVACYLQGWLQARMPGHWQVERVVMIEREGRIGTPSQYRYRLRVSLRMLQPQADVRYRDPQRKLLVTDVALPAGTVVTLPATMTVTGRDGQQVSVTMNPRVLPRTLSRQALAHRYPGWQAITTGSPAWQTLVDDIRAQLAALKQQQQQADTVLAELAQRQDSLAADLTELESDNGLEPGMAEPVERLTDTLRQLQRRQAKAQAQQQARQTQRRALEQKLEALDAPAGE
ncbi:hypothetical protein A11A3_01280 [Alcanivorax hongdengensis A-11-3]|uniref:Lipoprotein n=1 Tax=Alcanivorax hongdengensis A-11-3 TaxID=1177179 RepID=L0WH88_9GAMM|nr:hypothetical protein [Alcanivorax hongdengensis]EKF76084.1 hypothetical protein A11A3_01280 [Alcanivorax hongdengensis A-11-3]